MKIYVAEVIDGTPQVLRELRRGEKLPLGVILIVPAGIAGNVKVVLTIDFVTHYGRKYSADLRDGANDPPVDLMAKFEPQPKKKAAPKAPRFKKPRVAKRTDSNRKRS